MTLDSKRKVGQMGLPLDSVEVGHWLVCSRGPITKRRNLMNEVVANVNQEAEGILMKVLAVSAPFVFVRVYPMPTQDPNCTPELPFNISFNWNDVEFIRPSRGYLRLYLKLSRQLLPDLAVRHTYGRRPRAVGLISIIEPGNNRDERTQ